MVERIPIRCSDNNNNFNNVNKMRLESDILRDAINDCGSMIRKYQDDETKKDIRGFWWEQLIKLTNAFHKASATTMGLHCPKSVTTQCSR